MLAQSHYSEYLEGIDTETLRTMAKDIDHDCRRVVGNMCRSCDLIDSTERATLINILLEYGKEAV